jgi:hypothetical protein
MTRNIFIGGAIATKGALVAITKQFGRKQGVPAKAQRGGMSQFASFHYSAMSTAQAPRPETRPIVDACLSSNLK